MMMSKRTILKQSAIALVGLSWLAGTAQAKCATDSVQVGSVCMDTYEASVWRVPAPATLNKGLVKKIQKGTAKAADLANGGATQLGVTGDNYAPCTANGQTCKDDIYAVSLAGETPSAYITWFQANVACANAGKRLPSNAEWQMAVTGTQDPGPANGTTDCNTGAPLRWRTPARAADACRRWGLRHGGQFERVGGGLGAAFDGVSWMEQL